MEIKKAGISYGVSALEENSEGLNVLIAQVEDMVSQLGGALDEGSYGRFLKGCLSGLVPGEEIVLSGYVNMTAITPMMYPEHDMFVMVKAEGSITDRMISNMARSIYHHSIQMTKGLIFNITWTGDIQCCYMWLHGGKIYTFKFS